jgi:hypothetical protein
MPSDRLTDATTKIDGLLFDSYCVGSAQKTS